MEILGVILCAIIFMIFKFFFNNHKRDKATLLPIEIFELKAAQQEGTERRLMYSSLVYQAIHILTSQGIFLDAREFQRIGYNPEIFAKTLIDHLTVKIYDNPNWEKEGEALFNGQARIFLSVSMMEAIHENGIRSLYQLAHVTKE